MGGALFAVRHGMSPKATVIVTILVSVLLAIAVLLIHMATR
jgi:preprotein translocase subunit Sec61beta